MSAIKRFLLVFCLFAVPPGVLFAERYALVIGNSDYRHIQALNTPENDAADIAAALRGLGYQIDLRVNVGIDAMENAVTQYADRLARDPGNEGFFWYAGHGVQADNENFLLPVDIDAETVNQVKRASLSLSDLMMELENARNSVNVVIIDACRDNPLPAESRSLARGLAVMPVVQDTFVMFSTAAGATADDGAPGARNSPFTEAFLMYVTLPDGLGAVARAVSRETIARTNSNQRPYISDNILYIENYSLNPAIVTGDAPVPAQYAPQPAPAEVKSANVRANWISGGITPIIVLAGAIPDNDEMALNVRYERMLGSNISLGLLGMMGQGDTSLSLVTAGYQLIFSTDLVFRWYPWGKSFFVGVGTGYHLLWVQASLAAEQDKEYVTHGIGFTPELGWKVDPGEAGGFFLELGFLFSIVLGENPTTGEFEAGVGGYFILGMGGAF